MKPSIEPNTFTQGTLFKDEGFTSYIKTTDGEWLSIEGTPQEIKKTKSNVSDPDKIKKLEGLIKTLQGPARYFN